MAKKDQTCTKIEKWGPTHKHVKDEGLEWQIKRDQIEMKEEIQGLNCKQLKLKGPSMQ